MYIINDFCNTNNGDIMNICYVVLKSIFSIVVLFLVTKVVGKKQVSELSLFDYIIGISIGNFAAEIILDDLNEYILGLVAMVTFGISAFVVSVLSMKSIVFRRLVFGIPTIIIQDGKILVSAMKKVKIDINDLLEQARGSGYFDIGEIAYAIMEANGKISFLSKDKYGILKKKDMGIKERKDSLVANVIIDGNLMEKNIENADITKEWIINQLKVKGFSTFENIILATYKNKKLNVYLKNENIKVNNVLE